MKEEFDETAVALGTAAHEIKNALGPLGMTLQLAERQAAAGQPIAAADLAFARAQVRRISRLVADLMDMTRADLGQLALRPEPCDLAAIVTAAVETFRRGHAGEVSLAVEPALPVSVDRARIEQVLANLLENAARYSPAGAPIAVSAARSGAWARVTVADRGPGLAPDELERVFARFTRGTAAEGTGGLGLGLYLCRTLVERHGGRIGVDGAAGGGAAFWFELPSAP